MGLVAHEPQPSEFQIRHVQTSKLPIIDKVQAGLSCRRPCSALLRGLGPSFRFKQWVDRCPGYAEARRCGVFWEITGAVGVCRVSAAQGPRKQRVTRGGGLSPTCTRDLALAINDIFLKLCFPLVLPVAGMWEEF